MSPAMALNNGDQQSQKKAHQSLIHGLLPGGADGRQEHADPEMNEQRVSVRRPI